MDLLTYLLLSWLDSLHVPCLLFPKYTSHWLDRTPGCASRRDLPVVLFTLYISWPWHSWTTELLIRRRDVPRKSDRGSSTSWLNMTLVSSLLFPTQRSDPVYDPRHKQTTSVFADRYRSMLMVIGAPLSIWPSLCHQHICCTQLPHKRPLSFIFV